MVGLSRKRVFPKTQGDSITGQDRAQKHCDFRFLIFATLLLYLDSARSKKKSKVAVLQLTLYIADTIHSITLNCQPLRCDTFFLLYPHLIRLTIRARLFIDALWSSAGKGLTSWLSFVMSYCETVTFPLVSWVRCDRIDS